MLVETSLEHVSDLYDRQASVCIIEYPQLGHLNVSELMMNNCSYVFMGL